MSKMSFVTDMILDTFKRVLVDLKMQNLDYYFL